MLQINKTHEDQLITEAITAARNVQEFILGDINITTLDMNQWAEMFQKRVNKILAIDIKKNPDSALCELRKRVLQQAALSIKMLKLIDDEMLLNLKANGESEPPEPYYIEMGDGKKSYYLGADFAKQGSDITVFALMKHTGNGMWETVQHGHTEKCNCGVCKDQNENAALYEQHDKQMTAKERGEPWLCAMCGMLTVANEGELCTVCDRRD